MRAAVVVVVLVGAACQTPHVLYQPSPSERAADNAVLYRLDHLLTTWRVPMCHELDRELPNLAVPPPRTFEAMTAACDGGDAASCDELGWQWKRAAGDNGGHSDMPRPDLERFFGRGCDLGSDDACRALSNVFSDERKHQALLALAFALFHAGRTELSAEIWLDLPSAERTAFAPTFPALRAKLEAACASGEAKACETRAELVYAPDASWQPGPFDPKRRPWFVKACLAGSINACGWVLGSLDRDAVGRTEAVVDRACHGPTCDGLVAALHDSCTAGVWSSCYLAADACKRGGTVPGPTPEPTRPDVIFIPPDPPSTSVD